MRLDIYDTYVTLSDGARMHFDVLVEAGNDASLARSYAKQWINDIGLQTQGIQLDRCRFCHSEAANPEVESLVTRQGYAILQMEGCPSPLY